MNFFKLFFLLYCVKRFASCELILLSRIQEDIVEFNCIADGTEVNSTITWYADKNFLPFYNDDDATEKKKKIDITNNSPPWKLKYSYDYNPNECIYDERWEDFKLIKTTENQEFTVATKESEMESLTTFSFSAFFGENSFADIKLCDKAIIPYFSEKCDIIPLGLCTENDCQHDTVIEMMENYKWNHCKIYLENNKLHLACNDKTASFNSMISYIRSFKVIAKKGTSYWKINEFKYLFTEEKLSNVSFVQFPINQKEGVVVLFVSLCEACEMRLILSDKEKIISKNKVYNTEKRKYWQKVLLPFRNISRDTKELTIYLYTDYGINSKENFWKVYDKLTIYENEYQRNATITVNLEYMKKNSITCASFGENGNKVEYSKENKNFSCPYEKFGVYCNITLPPSIHSWSGSYKICNEKDSCTCSWGYWGDHCDKKCGAASAFLNTWGMNCQNECDECKNDEQCHHITGVCLNQKGLPLYIEVNNTYITIIQTDWNNSMGEINYAITYLCNNDWCDHKEDNISEIIPYEHKTKIIRHVPSQLRPFSNYTVNFDITRSNKLLETKRFNFTSVPKRPPKVRNFVAVSKNESMIWLRWKEPYPPNGILEKYKITVNNETSYKISKVTKCELWKDFLCATITNLQGNIIYNITIKAKNKDTEGYGNVTSIKVKTSETAPEPPLNVTMRNINETSVTITWLHPNITNGPIKQFNILFDVVDTASSNASSFPYKLEIDRELEQYNVTVNELSLSTLYTISIVALNKYKSERSTYLEIITPPPGINILNAKIQLNEHLLKINVTEHSPKINIQIFMVGIMMDTKNNNNNLDDTAMVINEVLKYYPKYSEYFKWEVELVLKTNTSSAIYSYYNESLLNYTNNVDKANTETILVIRSTYKDQHTFIMRDLKDLNGSIDNTNEGPTSLSRIGLYFFGAVTATVFSIISYCVYKKHNPEHTEERHMDQQVNNEENTPLNTASSRETSTTN